MIAAAAAADEVVAFAVVVAVVVSVVDVEDTTVVRLTRVDKTAEEDVDDGLFEVGSVDVAIVVVIEVADPAVDAVAAATFAPTSGGIVVVAWTTLTLPVDVTNVVVVETFAEFLHAEDDVKAAIEDDADDGEAHADNADEATNVGAIDCDDGCCSGCCCC